MKFSRILSGILAATVAATSLIGAMSITASAVNEDDYFQYSYNIYVFNPPEYIVTLKTDADFSKLNNGELVVPDTFDDGTNGSANVSISSLSASSTGNDTIKSIKTKSSMFSVNMRAFRYLNALEKVEYTNTGVLKANNRTFDSCSPTLKDIYIHASSVEFKETISPKQVFKTFIDNEGSKIHVYSETVKQQIIEGTAGASAPVTEDKIIVEASELPTPEVTVACEDIDYATPDGFKPTATVILKGAPVENPTVTYLLYDDADCTKLTNGNGNISWSRIPVGTYYIRATVVGNDSYQSARSKPLEVHVKEVVLDKTQLNEAIEAATSFKKSAVEGDYDSDAWRNVFGSHMALETAQTIAKDQNNYYGQTDIDSATKTLNEALEKLENSPADATAEWAELEKAIADAEALDKNEYTADSYSKLESALKSAKALTKETATKTKIEKAIESINTAIEGLVIDQVIIPAEGPIAYIYKGGKTTAIANGTADESMVGAAQIKFTFDCAADTGFNPNASIEIKAVVSGTENYNKFAGSDGAYKTGTTGWEVTLPLTNPIASGDSYELSGSTYAWNDAADYVYAITKVEFLDATGHILKTITDKTVAREELDAVIAEADEIDAAAYTEESYSELTKAIEAAKALTDESTVEELKAAAGAIKDAIAALVEVSKGNDVSGTVTTPGTDAEVTVTVATADGETVTEAKAANGEYTIPELEDGEYVITFAAEGYVTRSYTATVTNGEIDIEAELHAVGDINGDGIITTVDVGLANAHAKATKTLEDYDFEVAEVSGDEKITTVDVGMINATAKGA